MRNTYLLEPIWHKSMQNHAPAWLSFAGSMTSFMEQVSEQCLQVKLLSQAWQNPRPSEASLLAISKYSHVMAREVYLLCRDEICMFARSLFPVDALFGRGWQLQHLGEKPLGSLLFRDLNLRRSPFAFAILRAGHEDYAKATAHLVHKPNFLRARRSIFYWQQKELMVEEIFLPSSLDFFQNSTFDGNLRVANKLFAQEYL